MKNSVFSITLLLAAAMVVLAGCDPTLNTEGRKVKFTAASKSSPMTKTVYGGMNGNIQAINWSSTDKIRIYSPDTNVYVQNSDPSEPNGTWKPTDEAFELNYWYADYRLVPTASDPSRATLENTNGNGLAWNGSGTATFYAAYPFDTAISSDLSKQLRLAVYVPSSQTGAAADVQLMPMIAIQPNVSSGGEVNLNFYPAFSAFEFHLKSADNQSLTINSFKLESGATNEPLTGYCHYNLNLLPTESVATEGFDSHYLKNSALSYEQKGNSVEIPLNQTITNSSEAVFTIFTLPVALSNLTISVTFTPEGGTQTTKSLKLKKNDNWISFPAGHKALITGLAVEAGAQWNYKIQLDPDSIEWDLTTLQTSFSQNIQTTPFEIANAIENGWTDDHHYYPSGTEDYNIRTLDMNKNYGTTAGVPNKPYFVVTFRPQAPLGGYWRLDPQAPGDDQAGMGTAAFKVEVWDTDSNTGSTDLKGQIMDKTVTLHITSNVTDDQRTTDHAIILKSYFSTSVSFDENSTYSADSEIQDAHKDGSFSFWRFVIPKKN